MAGEFIERSVISGFYVYVLVHVSNLVSLRMHTYEEAGESYI